MVFQQKSRGLLSGRLYVLLCALLVALFLGKAVPGHASTVDGSGAYAFLDLMDALATGEVRTDEQLRAGVLGLQETGGYKRAFAFHGYSQGRNDILNTIYRMGRAILSERVNEFSGTERFYYEAFQRRRDYRAWVEQFGDWKLSDETLAAAWDYLPAPVPFTGKIYFVFDHVSDGYTVPPDMVLSVAQIERRLSQTGEDFGRDLVAHEFHHIVSKSLAFDKYGELALSPPPIVYLTGYVALEGIAVHATAAPEIKESIYQMGLSEEAVHRLFAKLERLTTELAAGSRSFSAGFRQHFDSMVDLYTIGTSMAEAIETQLGREALVETVGDPRLFFERYDQACLRDPDLYRFSQETLKAVQNAYAAGGN